METICLKILIATTLIQTESTFEVHNICILESKILVKYFPIQILFSDKYTYLIKRTFDENFLNAFFV